MLKPPCWLPVSMQRMDLARTVHGSMADGGLTFQSSGYTGPVGAGLGSPDKERKRWMAAYTWGYTLQLG